MSKRIIDEYTHRDDLSPQRKYALRKIRDGKCKVCGKKLVMAQLCLVHGIAERERRRATNGHKRRYRRAKTYVLKNFGGGRE